MNNIDDKKDTAKEKIIPRNEGVDIESGEDQNNILDQKQHEEGAILYSKDEKINHSENQEEESEDIKPEEEKLQQEIIKLREEKLRLLADMENLRKRTDKERLDSIRYGSMNLARDILSPDDNLTRALAVMPTEEKNTDTVNNLIDGLKMVQKEFSSILEKYGIKKIKALDAKFDHNFHQAMIEIENDEVEEGIIIQEIQSGYIMHDKLLRPSMVGVAKKSIQSKENIKDSNK